MSSEHLGAIASTSIPPNTTAHQNPALSQPKLDELATELKVKALKHIPTLPALYNLIRGSPSYHAAYISSERREILSRVLINDMGPEVFCDAFHLMRARHMWKINLDDNSNSTWSSRALDFISNYHDNRSLSSDFGTPTLDSLVEMANFHWDVHFMSARFCHHTLSTHPLTAEAEQSYESISRTETSRIYRALYRFELANTIFKLPAEFGRGSEVLIFQTHGKIGFFESFNWWEVEEVACVCNYLHQYFLLLIKDHRIKVRGFDSLDEFSETCSIFRRRIGADRCLTRSLTELNNLMRKPVGNPNDHLSSRIHQLEYMASCPWAPAIYTPLQNSGHHTKSFFSAYDRAAQEYNLYPPFISEHEGPNAAWAWLSKKRPDDWFTFLDPRARHLLCWSYILWDQKRLDGWGVRKSDIQMESLDCEDEMFRAGLEERLLPAMRVRTRETEKLDIEALVRSGAM